MRNISFKQGRTEIAQIRIQIAYRHGFNTKKQILGTEKLLESCIHRQQPQPMQQTDIIEHDKTE